MLPLRYWCADCGKQKLWYMFPYSAHERADNGLKIACYRCSINGIPKTERHIKFFVVSRLEKLIKISMTNKMQNLREQLFETIQAVKDDKISIEKAKSICDISQVIINTVKVEVEAIKAIGGVKKHTFLEIEA